MSYDFSNIRMMVDSTGKEMHKIVNSSGGVVWQKPYVWQQYNVVYTYRYNLGRYTNTKTSVMTNNMIAWSSYTLNQDNGIFEGTGEKFEGSSGLYCLNTYWEDYPYITYYENSNVIWEAVAEGDSYGTFTYEELYTYSVIDSSSCGSPTGKYFMSTTANVYPVDGEKNGYWYKRIQVGYSA